MKSGLILQAVNQSVFNKMSFLLCNLKNPVWTTKDVKRK